jgi:hypothetical protein
MRRTHDRELQKKHTDHWVSSYTVFSIIKKISRNRSLFSCQFPLMGAGYRMVELCDAGYALHPVRRQRLHFLNFIFLQP